MEALFAFFDNYQVLSTDAKAALLPICTAFNLRKGEHIQPIGKTCKTIYFIQSGLARIYYLKDGIDITESFAFEKNTVVRVESLFTGKPSLKGIQVIEDASVIAIGANRLFVLYNSFHEIERLFRKIFEASHVDTVNRIESLQFHTAEERYSSLLQQSPDIIKRVPLKYIASYLGITQTSLSRIRALR